MSADGLDGLVYAAFGPPVTDALRRKVAEERDRRRRLEFRERQKLRLIDEGLAPDDVREELARVMEVWEVLSS